MIGRVERMSKVLATPFIKEIILASLSTMLLDFEICSSHCVLQFGNNISRIIYINTIE